jgi:hypothetical protein
VEERLRCEAVENVPDWDNTESRESDEDAAWRDLVARFDAPRAAEGPVPWPTLEDVPAEAQKPSETDGVSETGDAGGADGRHRGREAGGEHGLPAADEERGRHAGDGDPGRHAAEADHGPAGLTGSRGAAGLTGDRGAPGLTGDHSAPGLTGDHSAPGLTGDRSAAGLTGSGAAGLTGDRGPAGPSAEPGAARDRMAGRHGRREPGAGQDPEAVQVPRTIRRPARGDEDHYIPPPPPPLPKLDPVAKGAWVALFGGPGYLVVATAASWPVSGLAAFCAVAAFVAGFAILVLRMHESGPGGPDDGDDGAVV